MEDCILSNGLDKRVIEGMANTIDLICRNRGCACTGALRGFQVAQINTDEIGKKGLHIYSVF